MHRRQRQTLDRGFCKPGSTAMVGSDQKLWGTGQILPPSLQKKTTLLMPWLQISGSQNWREYFLLSAPSLWSFVSAGTSKRTAAVLQP